MSQSLLLFLLCHLSLFASVTSSKVCGRPPISDNLDPTGIQRVYEVGEVLHLTCKPGYVPFAGSRSIVCTSTGSWTNPTLKCKPKVCGVPGPLQDGEMRFTDITFQSVINFTCNEGYVLHGANNSECLENGTWSNPLPVCKPVTCGLPEIPKYGKIIYHKKFKGNTTVFGDSVTYECLPPQALFGNERGFCTANGNWTELPECRFVICPVPPALKNGFMSFAVKREHGYKETIKYGCEITYILDGPQEIECQKTGTWSTLPVCRAPCTVNIKRGRIFYNGKKIWIGDLKPNMVLHSELVAVYCKNKEKNCGYPVTTQCVDGTLKIPECYEEPYALTYAVNSGSLPSEIKQC